MKIFKVLFALCVLTLVMGCSILKAIDKLAGIEKGLSKRYGAEEMITETQIAPVDLITLLDPDNKAIKNMALENMAPKFIGKIKNVDLDTKSIVVTGTDGTEKTFQVDDETKITKDTTILILPDLSQDMQVAVKYKKDGDNRMISTEIEVSVSPEAEWAKLSESKKLSRAFEAFYQYDQADSDKLKTRRNRLQDRLIAASNEQCKAFKLTLKLQRDIPADLIPSGIATITSGLGAIFTSVNTVRALSGSAAIMLGIKGDVLQTIYADKAMEVLTAAIDVRRKKKLDEIEAKRTKDIKDYTVEASISDAIEYHAGCTLIAALEEAAAAVQKQAGAAAPLSITTAPELPPSQVNTAYNKQTLAATGGTPPYTWTITGQPSWLKLDPKTGALSGTPGQEQAGQTISFNVEVTDSASVTNKKSFTLIIKEVSAAEKQTAPTAQLSITTASPLPQSQVSKKYKQTLAATGGTPPYTWTITGQPSWLKLDPKTGALSGTPGQEQAGQTISFNVEVTDSASVTNKKSFTLPIK